MSPELEPGDWALALAGAPFGAGHVVVVQHPERPGFELVKRVTGAPGDRDLGPDEWFVTGDNEPGSSDSRAFGPVKGNAIRGRVVAIYWPRSRRRIIRRLHALR